LHPTRFSFAQFKDEINPYYCAPQSIYSDHFQWESVSGPVRYKLEVPPLHPRLTSVLLMGHGESHFNYIQNLPNLSAMIALLRDGFNDDSKGGAIELASDGSVFPTSVGTNPQLPIYGIACEQATKLAENLTGKNHFN
jgi:hypothetical protein